MPLRSPAAIGASPGTGFESKPSYIPNDVIIPTLDDVPDGIVSPPTQVSGGGNWTNTILTYLDSNNMHWDFFINTNNACNLTSGPPECKTALAEILKLHYPGNHTVHHWHLGMAGTGGCPDPTCVQTELSGVESVVSSASGGARPHLTRFRAPFGEPYQDNGPGINFVPGAVAKFAVAIGWNLDSDDSNHDNGRTCIGACPTGQSVASTVQGIIKTPGTGSAYGIVLMHGIFGWTKDAIPLLFAPGTGYLARNGFRVGTVEDAICWKYGKHSWEIVQMLNGQARGPN
jgi:peptidoglycan/xylan/chitin deacetylase (PgdA/CDA1 family)